MQFKTFKLFIKYSLPNLITEPICKKLAAFNIENIFESSKSIVPF